MTVTELCPDDLLLAARQGELSALDDAKLTFHLGRCARCRAALEVGRSFDAVLGAHAGDDQIAMGIAARVTEPRRKRRFAYAIAAGVLLTGSLAGAAVSGGALERLFGTPATPKVAMTPPSPAPSPPSSRRPEPRAAEVAVPMAAEVPESTPVARAALAPAARAEQPSEPATPVSAADLFREANRLRSQGQGIEAQKRYRELQARFPAATEAKVSLVSVARLELAAQPAAALRHFDAYLAQSAHRTLAEEALFGRATALARLGRKKDERAAWQDLLARFPASIYAEQAEARLSAAP